MGVVQSCAVEKLIVQAGFCVLENVLVPSLKKKINFKGLSNLFATFLSKNLLYSKLKW